MPTTMAEKCAACRALATANTTASPASTGKDSTAKDSTEKDSTGKDSTEKDSTGKDSTGKESTIVEGAGRTLLSVATSIRAASPCRSRSAAVGDRVDDLDSHGLAVG